MNNTLFDTDIQPAPASKSAEWYTPPVYIEAARSVLGSIDLDPASCAEANRIVKAAAYYTQQDNGLAHPWSGRIWLNPPFGRSARMMGQRRSTIALFTEKLLQEYTSSNIEQAIALVTTEVNVRWYYPLLQYPICFPDHRVHFIVPGGASRGKTSQMFGTSFVYLGANIEQFINIFSQFGVIMKHASPVAEKYTTLNLWDSNINVDQQSEGGAA